MLFFSNHKIKREGDKGKVEFLTGSLHGCVSCCDHDNINIELNSEGAKVRENKRKKTQNVIKKVA